MGMLGERRARSRTALALLLATLGALVTAGVPARAEYPDRPIKVIVPFPPGGATDVVARLLTQRLSEDQPGWTFVIENKAGAGGIIATDATAKAAPDGYTLLLTTPNHTINAALKAKLPYDTEKDLVPVSIVGRGARAAGEPPGSAVQDLFRSSSTTPRTTPASSTTPPRASARLPHVTMELLLRRTGIQVAHMPYRGAAPAMTDLLAGHVQLKMRHLHHRQSHVAPASCARSHIASRERSPLMPERADRRRDGLARLRRHPVDRHRWRRPARPRPVIDKTRVRRSSARGRARASSPSGCCATASSRSAARPDAFAALISKEIVLWRELAKSAKISLD